MIIAVLILKGRDGVWWAGIFVTPPGGGACAGSRPATWPNPAQSVTDHSESQKHTPPTPQCSRRQMPKRATHSDKSKSLPQPPRPHARISLYGLAVKAKIRRDCAHIYIYKILNTHYGFIEANE